MIILRFVNPSFNCNDMRSIERRFKNIATSNPEWSSFICFTEAIKNQGFSCRAVQYWFSSLVKKDD